MAHYAYLENDVVTHVIVGQDERSGNVDWERYYGAVRTSYNTRGGVHYDPESGTPSQDQSKAFRFNFAGAGYTFDPEFGPHGAFIPPRPYPSWVLNPSTALWDPPLPRPSGDGEWEWDEAEKGWKEFTSAPQAQEA